MRAQEAPHAVVLRPVVSEKSYSGVETSKYAFRCAPDANKIEIRQAIEAMYAADGIRVVAVRTFNVRGKERVRAARGRRVHGFSPSWKKAIVTVAPGQKISGIFEGV